MSGSSITGNKIVPPSTGRGPPGAEEGSDDVAVHEKYRRLFEHLRDAADRGEQVIAMPIAEVGALTDGLPSAALTRKQWWSGTTSAQARAWIAAGWRVEVVGFRQQRVAFRRLE